MEARFSPRVKDVISYSREEANSFFLYKKRNNASFFATLLQTVLLERNWQTVPLLIQVRLIPDVKEVIPKPAIGIRLLVLQLLIN